MKVYEAILDQLIAAGVRHFSGMVGSTSAPYVGTLAQRNDVRYIGIRHEQVAAAMMDATARLSGRPGCVMTHGASGLLAASLGITSSALDSVPMIALSTTQERQAMEKGWWQTTGVLGPLADTAKWQTRVERPDQAVGAVRRALRESVAGKPGVAQIDIPIDVSTDETGLDVLPPITNHRAPLHRPWPDPAAVQQCGPLIRDAARPVILIGGGAAFSNAGDALIALAEKLHAPVVNTPTSRSVVPETHELVLGPSGIVGYEPIGNAIREADLVIAIGSRLSDIQTSRGELLPEGAPLIQVDIDGAAIGKEYTPTVGVCADARAFTESLNDTLRDMDKPDARRDWVASLNRRITDWYEAWHKATPDNGQVQPQELVRAMADLPADTIFTHGAGDHGFFGFMVPVAAPGAHLMSARLGAMGCALGSALGAKLERPNQPVVACVGDGDFMLQLGDVETMVRERLPVVITVFNNFRLGSQRKRVEAYGPVIGVDHGNPDFAKLAELFGCNGYRVDRPGDFDDALKTAMASGAPCIIDAIIDPEARPPRTAISREAR
jgi:acetolactate synthase-1/2/3 large subunit